MPRLMPGEAPKSSALNTSSFGMFDGCLGQREIGEQARRYQVCIEILSGDFARRTAVTRVVRVHDLNGGHRLLERGVREQPLAGGNVCAKTRILCDHRFAA